MSIRSLIESADEVRVLSREDLEELLFQGRVLRHVVTGVDLEEEPDLHSEDEMWVSMGCFWCAEARFMHIDGVRVTATGYCGGEGEATYEEVCGGETGHAEAVRIVYRKDLLQKLLAIFWESHDPTTHHAQGRDVGSQYRSSLWYRTDDQKVAFEKSRDIYSRELLRAGIEDPIATDILPMPSTFHYAEKQHQQYDAIATNRPYSGLAPLGVDFPHDD